MKYPRIKKENLVQQARAFAASAHFNQFRNDGVTPYFTHVEAVAKSLEKYSDEVQAIAYLHDFLEDCEDPEKVYTFMRVFPRRIVSTVLRLSKMDGEDYGLYITQVGESEGASIVKVADILHNLNSSPTEKARIKYKGALKYLVPHFKFTEDTNYATEADSIILHTYKKNFQTI